MATTKINTTVNENELVDADTLSKEVASCVPAEVKLSEEFVDELESAGKLPPYAIRFNELEALFGEDADLEIYLDDATRTATIRSSNYYKLSSLATVLKAENDGLKIEFVYDGLQNDYARIIEAVFTGNPHFDNVRIATEAGSGFKHVITTFKDETIQYDADNRFVPHGYETTLAEKLVKNLFKKEFRRSVYVTKEKEDEAEYLEF